MHTIARLIELIARLGLIVWAYIQGKKSQRADNQAEVLDNVKKADDAKRDPDAYGVRRFDRE